MTPRLFLIAGISLAGFLGGAAAKRQRDAPRIPVVAISEPAKPRPGRRPAMISLPHSADTLESLPAPDDPAGYARIALWLLDADAGEIAEFWKRVKQPWPGVELTELVFANWTRLDPRAALTAAAGGNFESFAWQGWAGNDPHAALAAARAGGHEGTVEMVAWAIGRYQPEWLRAHFEEIPAEMRDRALDGLSNQAETAQPLATLEFLRSQGRFNRELFQTLVRQDPWSAFDLLKLDAADPEVFSHRGEALADLAANLAETQPEALAKMVAETPAGALKRGLEAAQFASLLKSDPQAAMSQARETQSPRVAAERLAAVGRSLVESDSATARELAAELFSALPTALDGYTWVASDHGISGSGDPIPGVSEFTTALLQNDPAALLETDGIRTGKSAFAAIAGRWADSDFDAYAGWVDGQSDAVREMATEVAINHLMKTNRFQEAADWSLKKLQPESPHFKDAIINWSIRDPAAAAAWVENAELSDEVRASMSRSLRQLRQ